MREALAELTGMIGDRVRRGLPEASIVVQLGSSLWEIRDPWGVTKEAMAVIVLVPWLEWGIGTERDQAPRPPEADILPAHGTVTMGPRKTQQVGEVVHQGRLGAKKKFLRTSCRRQLDRQDRVVR